MTKDPPDVSAGRKGAGREAAVLGLASVDDKSGNALYVSVSFGILDISCVDHTPEELIAITIKQLSFRMALGIGPEGTFQRMQLSVGNLQIDDQLYASRSVAAGSLGLGLRGDFCGSFTSQLIPLFRYLILPVRLLQQEIWHCGTTASTSCRSGCAALVVAFTGSLQPHESLGRILMVDCAVGFQLPLIVCSLMTELLLETRHAPFFQKVDVKL